MTEAERKILAELLDESGLENSIRKFLSENGEDDE